MERVEDLTVRRIKYKEQPKLCHQRIWYKMVEWMKVCQACAILIDYY